MEGLVVNVEKSTIFRFSRGGGRREKVSRRWEGKVIEEVKEHKYLGCVSKKWIKLFDSLVWTVMAYGAEVWGWKEWEGV
ncbi:hypothetical protein ALC57_10590 [Trachymyrmex cornetzi]|uniref:Uncharacterized protein n=1 Tax=Trachymyrmex cornetzi TaxID=471704 RepID=A0A151J3W4_9HYME|nr:hypothetical protein ALC57_10590 [Trachymyrmex cornetzi]